MINHKAAPGVLARGEKAWDVGSRTSRADTQARLDEVAAEVNGRPRKTLGWMTPAQKLAELTTAV